MDATEQLNPPVTRRTTLRVIRVEQNPSICHNGTCMRPRRQDVLGPYCSWLCRNEDRHYDDWD